MSPDVVTALTGVVAVVLSWAGSAFIAGYRWGTVKTRLDQVEQNYRQLSGNVATKEQLAGVKEDLAEIKGMFRMVPRDGNAPPMS